MKMDLPLAASEPSPPDRSRLGLRLARDDLETRPLSQLPAPFWSRTTRARFEFAACIHRVKIHPVVDHFVITIALISRVRRDVKDRMTFESIFLFESYLEGFLWFEKTMSRGCSPLRRQSSMYKRR